MTQPQADIPPYRYTAELAGEIETRWQDFWEEHGTFHAPNPVGPLADPGTPRANADKLYWIDMFPYPSGSGLHVGHPLGYIGTDCFTRYHRMVGHNVLHPMGFDAFGLPAEQYAVQTGTHPRKTTEENVDRYRAQLRRLGLAYDSRRSFATTDVAYYRWTQWIFLQIFNSWYDPAARRARPIAELIAQFAAGERPVPGGRSWAELTGVEQREIVDGHRLAYVSHAPVNWCPGLGTVLANEEITADGRSERGNFPVFKRNLKQWMMRITAYADRLLDDLDVLDWPEPIKLMQRNWIGRSTGAHIDFPFGDRTIRVFTTRPDTVFGATYMVLAPEHELVDGAVPAAWPEGTKPAWTGGHANPAEAGAADRALAARETEAERTAEHRQKTGVFIGAYATNPVNGQRIPVFIADYVLAGYGTGAIMAVPGQDERDRGDGPRRYTRETNTMPQWAGSCWYELRYLDPTNDQAFVDPENERCWMGPQWPGDCGGVDLYVGGVEHAVLHLLYARFWHKVLYDLGHLSSFEPFRRLFNQGYVTAYAYTDERGTD